LGRHHRRRVAPVGVDAHGRRPVEAPLLGAGPVGLGARGGHQASLIVMLLTMTTRLGAPPRSLLGSCWWRARIAFTTSRPLDTLPNVTYVPWASRLLALGPATKKYCAAALSGALPRAMTRSPSA